MKNSRHMEGCVRFSAVGLYPCLRFVSSFFIGLVHNVQVISSFDLALVLSLQHCLTAYHKESYLSIVIKKVLRMLMQEIIVTYS